MTAYLIRRLFQMLIVTVLSAMLGYTLLYLAPGGPLVFLQQMQNTGQNRVSEEDIARLKARYELDLYLPVRFTRWLIGFPSGPVRIGGWYLLPPDMVVGCAIPGQVRLRYPDGRVEIREEGCARVVTLADLENRPVSRGILFGDFGLSQQIARDRPVSDLLMSRLPYTLWLMGVSTLLAILIGVPLGIYSAVRQYSRFDYAMTTITFIGSSLPTLFMGVMAILIFSVLAKEAGLPYLPSGGAEAERGYTVPWIGRVEARSLLDRLLRFIMPVSVLTFFNIAGWSRFVRASMLEVLRQDYVRTARAKGVREQLVITKHALRNALIPFITLLAGVLPTLVAGAAITESVFNWPGMGRLLVDALERSDYTVAMAILFISTVLVLIGYLISDILYTIVDPRIRLS
ncbi:MAG: ABC transporter permease [Oscillochloridaceae bacterium]|nr:ABC transporter permease [Chloroflexaceae bacterium]MDW8390632.1 ABC transporter permease [Oscillochloridaceae bacterium]